MRIGHPRIYLAALALLVVSWLVGTDLFRTAPGPVSASHAALPELVGIGSCRHCHGGWFGDMTSSCLSCHEPIAQQIAGKAGLHGGVAAERIQRCGACHGEHHGEMFAIVNRLSFAAAGVADPARFDHAGIGYAMAGKHSTLECATCHTNAESRVLAKGQRRYLGLSQECSSCHEDPHNGRMALACAQCHGQQDFAWLEPMDHAKVLPLDGAHAGIACQLCHAAGQGHSLDVIGAKVANARNRECGDCHDSPHSARFLTGLARAGETTEAKVCTSCHGGKSTFAEPAMPMSAAQHALSGFLLETPHEHVDCVKCHAGADGGFVTRYPGRTADACQACHQDVHRGEFLGRPLAANGCVSCHARTHFTPHEFTKERHELTAFALTGRHVETECRNCHLPRAQGEVPAFVGTAIACAACHGDAHDGFFASHGKPVAAERGGGCAECHGTTRFADLPHGFAHAERTGFALCGAHEEARCESCHVTRPAADPSGRRFGKVDEKFGAVKGCASCHLDPHEGAFDKQGLPTAVAGRSGCARCHAEVSFRALASFDHGAWTGFPLLGAHHRAECAKCHQGGDGGARTWKKSRGKKCADCHEDPHGGQFSTFGPPDCKRCHASGDGFKELVFRHDLHSRFALGPQHERLACSACHKPTSSGAGAIVRYRPLPMQCAD